MSDILIPEDQPPDTLLGILHEQGKEYLISFIPIDDVHFVEKWQHTFIVLLVLTMVLCMFGWMALWERLSRLRITIVIILLFFFVFTIQTFAL